MGTPDYLQGTASKTFFQVTTGTKQGIVLSPKIFAVYINDLISRLRGEGIGCHILNLFVACSLYTDDLCLLAPTRDAMQQMLLICQAFCGEFCSSFNPKKSKILCFGDFRNISVAPLNPNRQLIEFTNECEYLVQVPRLFPVLNFPFQLRKIYAHFTGWPIRYYLCKAS